VLPRLWRLCIKSSTQTVCRSFGNRRQAIASDPTISDLERKAQLQNNSNQTSQLNTGYAIQSAQDRQAYNPASTSMLNGAGDALTQFVIASRDGARMMRDIVGGTLTSLNAQIVNGLAGGKTDFRGMAISASKNLAEAGLKKTESGILGMFGVGNGKLGTKGNPIYTMPATGLPGITGQGISLKGIGGGFKKLFSFLPHFANGGDYNGLSVAGENGPELISGSGHVTSNKDFKSMLSRSGDTHIYYNIDAKGTDPVQTEMRVRAAIASSQRSSVAHSIAQQQDQSRRVPGRAI
jgi:hypothetical protein